MKIKFTVIALILCLFMATMFLGCQPKGKDVVIPVYTPRAGGTAYIIGGGIADLINKEVAGVQMVVEATTGTEEIVKLVTERYNAGKEAFSVADAGGYYFAYKGGREYDKPHPHLRAVTYVHAADLYLVVRAESPIQSYADLKGKKVGVGSPGSAVEVVSNEVFEAHGVTRNDYQAEFLSYAEVVTGLTDKVIDAGVLAGAYPVAAYSELNATHKIRIVPVETEVIENLISKSPYYYLTSVEPDAYPGITEEVPIVGYGVLLETHENVDEEIVYNVVKNIFEHNDRLVEVHGAAREITLENALRSVGIPLHPGAERYFREQGVIK